MNINVYLLTKLCIKNKKVTGAHTQLLLTILLAVSQTVLNGYTYHSGKQKYVP